MHSPSKASASIKRWLIKRCGGKQKNTRTFDFSLGNLVGWPQENGIEKILGADSTAEKSQPVGGVGRRRLGAEAAPEARAGRRHGGGAGREQTDRPPEAACLVEGDGRCPGNGRPASGGALARGRASGVGRQGLAGRRARRPAPGRAPA
ncbi:hypothetical protein NL676_035100 [Syzygium grande]|nr:hypothetical protein NL676_035100 [Syzygium grande]